MEVSGSRAHRRDNLSIAIQSRAPAAIKDFKGKLLYLSRRVTYHPYLHALDEAIDEEYDSTSGGEVIDDGLVSVASGESTKKVSV